MAALLRESLLNRVTKTVCIITELLDICSLAWLLIAPAIHMGTNDV